MFLKMRGPYDFFKRIENKVFVLLCLLFFVFTSAVARAQITRDITPPSTPSGFNAVAISTTEIDLSWNAATDTVGVAGYTIMRIGVPPSIDATGTAYADTGLLPATTYTYIIAAHDDAGNVSALSTPVSTTTMAVSTKFSKNDRVQATTSLNVRSAPSLSSSVKATEVTGVLGHIMGGPAAADSYAWWQVIYDDGVSGWSVEDYLVKIPETAVATSTTVAFSMGNRVRTTTNLNVRSEPSLSSTINWIEMPNALGSIIGGPTSTDSYSWWRVKYDDGPSGWSVEQYLANAAPTTSDKFSIGDSVQTTGDVSVLATPTIIASTVGAEKAGARGIVNGGPTAADGHIWWKVNFSDGVTGWVIESSLTEAVVSDKFSIGDSVQTTAGLNVRASPSTSATVVGTESAGAGGTVSGGPLSAGSYNWWQIVYNDGVSGWSIENYLEKTASGGIGSASSSSKFAAGSRVQTTAGLNVRNLPTISSVVLGTQPSGAQGAVTGISYFADDYWWWNINYDTGPDGWSVENYLASVTTGPSVKITSPANGANVSGDLTITASVSGGDSITRVEFYWGGGGGTSFIDYDAPYSISISTLNSSNGKKDIFAKAYDNNGVYTSQTVTVNVNNVSKFKVGDRVQVATTTLDVRAEPIFTSTSTSVLGGLLGTHSSGTLGVVSSGPRYINSEGWWFINYDSDPDGWSLQNSLKKYTPPPDKAPPVVFIVSPKSSEIISGTFSVLVNATDNIGVAKVYLYVDGVSKGVDSELPYSFTWDTSSTLNASHTLVAKAYDGTGNNTSSAPVVVATNNPDVIPPVVRISSPLSGQKVSGISRVSVSATDNVKVASVNLLVDGSPVGSEVTSSVHTFFWDTNLVANNTIHILNAVASDASGNVGASADVTVNVENPPPSTKFSIGDRVMTTSTVNVRSMPSTYASVLGTRPEGAIGTVIGGSEYSDTYFWWKIDFDSGQDGWVAENYIEKISENLLIDPGLESGGSAWQNSASAGRMVTTSYSHSGTKSEEINVSNSALQPVYQDVTAVNPGASYIASGWIKASGAGGSGARIYLLWFSGSTVNYVFPSSVSSIYSQGGLVRVDYVGGVAGTGGWTNFSDHLTAPWTAKVARFLIVTDKDADGAGSAWFDDLGFYRYGPLPASDTAPPTVTITSPKNNSFVKGGTVNVNVTVTDNTAISQVDISIDNNLVVSRTTSPYSYSWNTLGIAEGFHTIKAMAADVFGNSTFAASTVGIDKTPPTVPTGLQAQAASSTQVNLTWNPSSDNTAVAGYKIVRNGSVVATISTSTVLSYADKGVSGSACYTYSVSAFDGAGNNSTSSVSVGIMTTTPPPSTKFVVGRRVMLASSASVTSAPSGCTSGAIIGSQEYTDDHVPPTVTLTSPADGSTIITSTFQFAASANDAGGKHMIALVLVDGGTQGTVAGGPVYVNSSWWWQVDFDSGSDGWVRENYLKNGGVAKVEFYAIGIMVGFTSSSPYAANFDIAGFPSLGPYPFYAKAYDAAGNAATSATNYASVSPPARDTTSPTITITSPAENSTLSGTVTASADASDNIGVTRVEFYVDTIIKDSKTTAPYNFSWNTIQEDNGPHVIHFVARDAAGNIGTSAFLPVIVQN